MSHGFDDLRFAVVDVEGNGQQPPEIVEIAILPIDGMNVAGEPVAWLVKPERPIAPIVTRKVHGISNADVADAPGWSEVAPEVAAALADRIPIAHNARVEYDVLRRHMPSWAPATVLDTLRLARAVWPDLGDLQPRSATRPCRDRARRWVGAAPPRRVRRPRNRAPVPRARQGRREP